VIERLKKSATIAACLLALQMATLANSAVRAEELEGNDLRDIRVGMAAADLNSSGYVDFACAADLKRGLDGWTNWRDCPADSSGMRAIRFGYDPLVSRDGTLVAGHPAVLTLLINDSGRVAELQIETDPKARLFLRKKAFLLGQQAKSRYGAEGWACTEGQPGAEGEPVGGVYLREHCTKTTGGRSLTVERNLFRRPGQDIKNFVDETRIRITAASK
jgi:hypothetical protein